MTIRDIAISFGYDIDKASEKKANDSINTLKSTATKLIGALAVGFSISGLSKLSEAAANVEALNSQFTQVFSDMEKQANVAMRKVADDAGMMSGRLRGSFTQIAAFAKTTGMNTADALGMTERAIRAATDSAAFYDKSVEEVTNSLQSFLKGNFANDAALGLSATETTRNAAANALYGKSYRDLAEDQKQLTLLKMVEDANAASGALGQAAREADTWGNQLGNMKQAIAELKAVTGGVFLQSTIQVVKLFTYIVVQLTTAINDLNGEGRLLNRMFARIANEIKKAQVFIERFIARVGGAEKALRLLMIIGSAIFTALNAGKILAFLRAVGMGLKGISLKMATMVAIFVIIALIIDDLINFMSGNDSLMGGLFEKFGLDGKQVRETIRGILDAVKALIPFILDLAKQFGGMMVNALKQLLPLLMQLLKSQLPLFLEFIKRIGKMMMEFSKKILPVILRLIESLLPLLFQVVDTALPLIISLIETILPLAFQIINIALPIIIELLTAVLPILMEMVSSVLPVILILIMAIIPLAFQIIEAILPVILELITAILPIMTPIIKLVASLVNTLLPPVISLLILILPILKPILGILKPIADILGTIIGAIAKVVGWVAKGFSWVVDVFTGAGNGGNPIPTDSNGNPVKAHARGTNRTEDTFVAGEEGAELVTGARGRKVFTHAETGNIFQTLKDIASLGLTSTAPRSDTVAASTSSVENKSVVQHNQFTNQFYGDRAGQKMSAEAMEKSADDATALLSRGLAYVR